MGQIDKSMFQGDGEGPEPVWRDEAEDATTWPVGAAFKIHFTPENSPGASVTYCELPRTEFYGIDGWPLDISEERKCSLPLSMRRRFQIFPSAWHRWSDVEWVRVLEHPEHFDRIRTRWSILRPLARITSRIG